MSLSLFVMDEKGYFMELSFDIIFSSYRLEAYALLSAGRVLWKRRSLISKFLQVVLIGTIFYTKHKIVIP